MPTVKDHVLQRFKQLAEQAQQIPMRTRPNTSLRAAETLHFYTWASSALNLLQGVFGKTSPHYERLDFEISRISNNVVDERHLSACIGIFIGAKSDADGGHLYNLEASLSGELFGDFVFAAKAALDEGQHTVACVLACAALEDALKRYAVLQGFQVDGKTMDEVVNLLKSQGLVSGAQKKLLEAMPKIRNYAMHAEWAKLTPEDAGSVIGYVEQFLLAHFS